MATFDVAIRDAKFAERREEILNDFNIQVATVNGSGSHTANLVLLRAIFQMGIPVSGKNLFPSNIAGLSTWYTIRVNKNGYVARRETVDILVAMNPESAREDVLSLSSGAVVVYDEVLNLKSPETIWTANPVPLISWLAKVCPEAKLQACPEYDLRRRIVTPVNIDMSGVKGPLRKQFRKKAKAADLNFNAAKAGYEFAEANLTKTDPYHLERMNLTEGKIIIDGNSAAALGCLFAGVTVVAWYPITPSSSLCESLIEYLKRYRIDKETGKATFAVVQAARTGGAGWPAADRLPSDDPTPAPFLDGGATGLLMPRRSRSSFSISSGLGLPPGYRHGHLSPTFFS